MGGSVLLNKGDTVSSHIPNLKIGCGGDRLYTLYIYIRQTREGLPFAILQQFLLASELLADSHFLTEFLADLLDIHFTFGVFRLPLPYFWNAQIFRLLVRECKK
jgi:hypothetical protein